MAEEVAAHIDRSMERVILPLQIVVTLVALLCLAPYPRFAKFMAAVLFAIMAISKPLGAFPNGFEFQAHFISGFLLLAAAQRVLAGDGGPITLSWFLALPPAVLSLVLLHGDITHTFYLAHAKEHSSVALMFFGMGAHDVLVTRGWRRCELHVCQLRQLLDPAIVASLGVAFIVHKHDTREVAMLWHMTLGFCLIAAGLVTYASYMLHAAAPPAECLRLARSALAFTWALTGFNVLFMAIALYAPILDTEASSPAEAAVLHFTKWKTYYHTEMEAVFLYFSVEMCVSALLVALMGAQLLHLRDSAESNELDDKLGGESASKTKKGVRSRSGASKESELQTFDRLMSDTC